MCVKLGMSKEDMDFWRELHVKTIIASKQKISCHIPYQTKSGDASTALVNTYTSMTSMTKVVKALQPMLVLAMGDDVTIASQNEIDLHAVELDLTSRFNLSVKMSVTPTGSFCGGFIVKTLNKWVYTTDIIKRIEKLGRKHNPNENLVVEQFISFNDIMKPYSNGEVRLAAATTIASHYETEYDLGPAIFALN